MRVCVSGSPISRKFNSFKAFNPSRVWRRTVEETPAGLLMNIIGSPADRKETPEYSPGKTPDDQSRPEIACTCSVLLGLAMSTTNVGRSWFIEPRPYETQEPRQGRPVIWFPVCM